MNDFISANRYLNLIEMRNNAPIIFNWLYKKGWNPLSIYAVLGNMQVESTINPGLWRGHPETTGAFGLVQWSPSSKIRLWAQMQGLNPDDGFVQLQRIQYELENNQQWVYKTDVGLTFLQFATNSEGRTLRELSDAWCLSYEIPDSPDLETRYNNALYWQRNISYLPLWLLFKFKRR